MQKAAFGAGCFWGVEVAFQKIKGVKSTIVGYMGGNFKNPTYEDVCTDKTGHAEVVQIEYDPKLITYEELLEIFWKNHDPTELNRQGLDFGTQYRSIIFYYNDKQKKLAEESKKKKQVELKNNKIIVTEITSAKLFYPAEEYHQKYLEKHGRMSCKI
jgi:peptide-methionine (S)-S-oxide reductase